MFWKKRNIKFSLSMIAIIVWMFTLISGCSESKDDTSSKTNRSTFWLPPGYRVTTIEENANWHPDVIAMFKEMKVNNEYSFFRVITRFQELKKQVIDPRAQQSLEFVLRELLFLRSVSRGEIVLLSPNDNLFVPGSMGITSMENAMENHGLIVPADGWTSGPLLGANIATLEDWTEAKNHYIDSGSKTGAYRHKTDLLIPGLDCFDDISHAKLAQSETVKSDACYGPNTKCEILTRKDAAKRSGMIGQLDQLFNEALSKEEAGKYEEAATQYTMTMLALKSKGVVIPPFFFARATFEMDEKGRVPDVFPLNLRSCAVSATDTMNTYHTYKDLHVLDKLKSLLLPLGQDSNVVIARKHIQLFRDLISFDKVCFKGKGYIYIGNEQIDLFIKGMLEYGVILSRESWSILDKSLVPPKWNLDTRSPLEGIAFYLDDSRAFVPGYKLLCEKESFAPKLTYEEFMTEHCWELCITNTSWDDLRDKAFTAFDSGWFYEAMDKNNNATMMYGVAMKTLTGFSEPILACDRMGLYENEKGMKKIATTIRGQVNQLDNSIAKVMAVKGDISQQNVAARATYLIKNIVVGRMVAATGDLYQTENMILGQWFVDRWENGMRGWGVKLHGEWELEELKEGDWADAKKLDWGFYKGASIDEEGNLMIPGVKRIKR